MTNMKKAIPINLLLFLMGLALVGCARTPGRDTPRRAEALIVVPGAADITYQEAYDGIVSYTADVPYPAPDLLAEISSSLQAKGWRPVQHDLLDPTIPSSHLKRVG